MPEYRLTRPKVNGKPTLVWYVTWTEARRSCRQSTGSTDLVQAKAYLRRLEAIRNLPPETFSVGDLCDAYQKNREDDPRVVYPKAIRNCLNHVRRHFGPLPPSMISRATVRSYVGQRRKDGVADASITKELGFLRQALKFGVNEGWMKTEPRVEVPGGHVARERYLTRTEFATIYFHSSPLHLRVFLALSIDTLARGKHVLALTWDRVDFDRGVVWYKPHRAGSKKKTQPAPMTDRLRAILLEAQKAAQGPFVVEWAGGGVKSVRKAWETALRSANGSVAAKDGITDAHRHDLRRSGASWAVQGGMSFDDVAALLGDSVEITRRHYSMFAPEHLKRVVDTIAGGSGGRVRA